MCGFKECIAMCGYVNLAMCGHVNLTMCGHMIFFPKPFPDQTMPRDWVHPERFIITTQDGDVVELDPTEDSQVALAVNGIPTQYAITYNCIPPGLPGSDSNAPAVAPEPAATETAVTEPVATEPVTTDPIVTEPAVTEPPQASSSATSVPNPEWPDEASACASLKRKAAIAQLDQLELN